MSSRDSGTVNQETRPGVSETEQDQGHVGKRLARRDEGVGEIWPGCNKQRLVSVW